MPFGFTNAPATFQCYIADCLHDYIDDFAVCYLDDILIYLTDQKEKDEHAGTVLERLQEFSPYIKAEQCQFGVSQVAFLGFVKNSEAIGIESDLISTIEDWPTPKLVRDIQVPLGFANFSRWFIRKYAKIT